MVEKVKQDPLKESLNMFVLTILSVCRKVVRGTYRRTNFPSFRYSGISDVIMVLHFEVDTSQLCVKHTTQTFCLPHRITLKRIPFVNFGRQLVQVRLRVPPQKSQARYDLRRRPVQYSVRHRVWKNNYVLSKAVQRFNAKLAP